MKIIIKRLVIYIVSVICNLGHNISELYSVLVQIRLTTSKTKRDIRYDKLGRQVASRAAEQLNT